MYSGMKWEGVVSERGERRRRMDRADSTVFILHATADVLLVAVDRAINQGPLHAAPTAYYIQHDK